MLALQTPWEAAAVAVFLRPAQPRLPQCLAPAVLAVQAHLVPREELEGPHPLQETAAQELRDQTARAVAEAAEQTFYPQRAVRELQEARGRSTP